MKLGDFSPDVAKRVMELWKEHLGFFYDTGHASRYLEYPDMLADDVRNTSGWVTSRYEDRFTSRFSDDSKFFVNLTLEGLEITCYVQYHGSVGREEAEQAEKNFNKAVKEYIQNLSKD